MMRRTFFAVFTSIALVGCLGILGCSGNEAPAEDQQDAQATQQATQEQQQEQQGAQAPAEDGSVDGELVAEQHTATVKVEGYDPFTIELDGKNAPITVTNFVKLADSGYYDGLAFYRVVKDFCLQGGTKGNSASGNDSALEPIKGEFSQNGVENLLADNFKKGVVAMARTSDPDSATSTFFITLGTSDSVSYSLDGQYAAFGTIDRAGMKVVDQIVKDMADADADEMGGLANEDDMPVIKSIKIK